jgi:hypothetical protein
MASLNLSPISLSTGSVVEITGLQSRADLNGMLAHVGKFAEDANRWVTTLIQTREQVRLKPECLILQIAPGCEVELQGLQSRTELNGRIVVAREFDLPAGRWIVELSEPNEMLRCKMEHLKTPLQRAKEEAERNAAAERAAAEAAAQEKAKEEAAIKAAAEKKAKEEAELKAAAAKAAEEIERRAAAQKAASEAAAEQARMTARQAEARKAAEAKSKAALESTKKPAQSNIRNKENNASNATETKKRAASASAPTNAAVKAAKVAPKKHEVQAKAKAKGCKR